MSPEDRRLADAASAALDQLTARQRAAVVFTFFEDLDEDDLGALLKSGDGPQLVIDSLERMGPAFTPQTLSPMLEALAATFPPPPSADALAADAREHRNHRLKQAGIAAGLVGALAVGWAYSPSGDATSPSVASPPRDLTDFGPYMGQETRGSLASDSSFLAGVADSSWGPSAVPPEDRFTVYAGDASDVRWVLEAGHVDSILRFQLSVGPAGTPAAGPWEAITIGEINPTVPFVATAEGPAGPLVMAIAAPEDDISVSPGRVLDPASTRLIPAYQSVPDQEGVFIGPVGRTHTLGLSVEVRGGGQEQLDISPQNAAGNPLPTPENIGARPGTAPPAAVFVSDLLARLAGQSGWTVNDLEVLSLGSGTIPVADYPLSGLIVAARMPDGSVVVSGGIHSPADGGVQSCGSLGYPAGTALTDLTATFRCSTLGQSVDFLISSASPETEVTLTNSADNSTTTFQIGNDGWSATTLSPGATYNAAEADGQTTTVGGPANDILGG